MLRFVFRALIVRSMRSAVVLWMIVASVATGENTFTATGSLATGRQTAGAILMGNGKVLMAGGTGASRELSSAELYDPVTGRWSVTGSLGTPRQNHAATLLTNGRLLMTGGFFYTQGTLSSAELCELPVSR